jgi:hypothetical protein
MYELDAMAEPQPNVLNTASWITPLLKKGHFRRYYRTRQGRHAPVVDANLEFHDIAARGRADETSADIRVVLVERADLVKDG